MSVLVAFVAAVLAGCGAWLLLQRRLSRIIIGVGLLGHAANLLLLVSGSRSGGEPLIGLGDAGEFTDPLPQALALTAIVITFGITTFLLAVGFRAWQVTRDDEVEDDIEDRYLERLDRDLADEMVAERAQAADEGRTWEDTPEDASTGDASTGEAAPENASTGIDTTGIDVTGDDRDGSGGAGGRP